MECNQIYTDNIEKDKEFIMFDDMHNISRSQQVMIKIATMELVGW